MREVSTRWASKNEIRTKWLRLLCIAKNQKEVLTWCFCGCVQTHDQALQKEAPAALAYVSPGNVIIQDPLGFPVSPKMSVPPFP